MLGSALSGLFVPIAVLIVVQTESDDSGLITVDIAAQSDNVAIGQPVLFSVTVINHLKDTVKLINHNAPTLEAGTLSSVDLLLSEDGGHFERWSDRLRPRERTEPSILLAGERIEIDLVLLFSLRGGFFATESGKYLVRVRIVAHDLGEILSAPIAIEVREPSPSDRTAWQWLDAHKEEYGRLVQIPWEAELSDEFAREAGRLAETSRSVYAEYLALFLGRWYDEGKGKDAEQAARFAEIAKAKASSEKVRSEAEKLLAKFQKKPPQP